MYRTFITVGMIMGWVALILQFWLMMVNRAQPVPGAIIQFFSYFTILTNILVALYFTFMLLRPQAGNGWLARASTATALTVYIIVVGAVYNLVLRQTWEPKGWQKLVDELLHTIIPLYFLAYWTFFADKKALKWNDMFSWLLYPLVYCIYVLARGGLTNAYPYPFIDVTALGMGTVLRNCVVLFIVFLALSAIFIGIAKFITARRLKQHGATSTR